MSFIYRYHNNLSTIEKIKKKVFKYRHFVIYKKKNYNNFKMLPLCSIKCDSIDLDPQEQRVFNMIFPVMISDQGTKTDLSSSINLFNSNANDRLKWWMLSAIKLTIIYLFLNPLFSKDTTINDS